MQLLSTVVLEKDLLSLGLKRGDRGAVVGVYEPDGLEVEFVTALGSTQAIVTLKRSDVQLLTNASTLTAPRVPENFQDARAS